MESAMTTLTQPWKTVSPFGRLVRTIAGMLVVSTRALVQTLKNRRDAAMLTGLDDRMLADIGLTRGDVRDAYSEPVWRDPTAILVSRAHERRINRRRTVIGLDAKVFDAPSIVPAQKGHAFGTPLAARC
jgi:uncharacterized protein YjiS (DUF1127 family)